MFVLNTVVLCVLVKADSVHLVRHRYWGCEELFVTLYLGFKEPSSEVGVQGS